MPQVFVMLSLYAQQQLANKKELNLFVEELDGKVSDCLVHLWKVPQEDVAMSAMSLVSSRGEADVQVEIRYTAGEDEYDLGSPFEPSLNEQIGLADAIFETLEKREFGLGLTFSVWCKPHCRSHFKMGPTRS